MFGSQTQAILQLITKKLLALPDSRLSLRSIFQKKIRFPLEELPSWVHYITFHQIMSSEIQSLRSELTLMHPRVFWLSWVMQRENALKRESSIASLLAEYIALPLSERCFPRKHVPLCISQGVRFISQCLEYSFNKSLIFICSKVLELNEESIWRMVGAYAQKMTKESKY